MITEKVYNLFHGSRGSLFESKHWLKLLYTRDLIKLGEYQLRIT